MSELPRRAPEARGVDPKGILAFLDAVEQRDLELHALAIYRRGAVITEAGWAPYQPNSKHSAHSLTKSFLAAGIGALIDEGRLGLGDRVATFFEEELPPEQPDYLKLLTVRDLLTMTAGQARAPSGAKWRTIRSSWAREFFKEPVVERPGERFLYSSANSYMLSAIAQRVTGRPLAEYMAEKILHPLGIVDFTWDACPNGVSSGGNGLSVSAADALKLGVLHLRGGVWESQRLLSEWWVRESTSIKMPGVSIGTFEDGHQVAANTPSSGASGAWHGNYGYHWWVRPGGAYYGSGFFGQFLIVVPAREAVIAVNAAVPLGNDSVLDLIWQQIIPAMKEPPALPPNGAAGELPGRLANLRVQPPPVGSSSPLQTTVDCRVYRMNANDDEVESVSVEFDNAGCTLRVVDRRGTHEVKAALGSERAGVTTLTGGYLHHSYEPDRSAVVASAQWRTETELVFEIVYVEMTFRDRVELTFSEDGERLRYDRSSNVNSGPKRRPTIFGERRD